MAATLAARVHNTDPFDSMDAVRHYVKMDWDDLQKCYESYGNTGHFNALFSEKVIWNEMDLIPQSCFVNRVFDTLLGKMGLHNSTLKNIAENMNEFSDKEIEVVNMISRTLLTDPRVIVLTTSVDEYCIYDGWHTSLAFYLRNKSIPCYVGTSSEFDFYY